MLLWGVACAITTFIFLPLLPHLYLIPHWVRCLWKCYLIFNFMILITYQKCGCWCVEGLGLTVSDLNSIIWQLKTNNWFTSIAFLLLIHKQVPFWAQLIHMNQTEMAFIWTLWNNMWDRVSVLPAWCEEERGQQGIHSAASIILTICSPAHVLPTIFCSCR